MKRDGTASRFVPLMALATLLAGAPPAALASPVSSAILSSASGAASVGPMVVEGSQTIAPQVTHRWGTVVTEAEDTQAVNLVEVAPGDPNIRFEALLSNDTAIGTATVGQMAAPLSVDGRRAVAAVNGDTFNGYLELPRNAPAGLHVHGGELMVARLAAKPTVGFRADGSAIIGMPKASLVASTLEGEPFAVAQVNQWRRLNQVALYTDDFGPSTLTSSAGIEVLLDGSGAPLPLSGTYDAMVVTVSPGVGDSPIPEGQLVLSGAGARGERLASLVPGEVVHLDISVTDGWQDVVEAVSGRHQIIDDGVAQVVDVEVEVPSPRTAIGLRADGTVVLATVDGRQSGYSLGLTIAEVTDLMLAEGAVDALNMDGGGSTTALVRQPGDPVAGLVNRPSDGHQRKVSNSLAVVSQYPTTALAAIVVRPATQRMLPGQTHLFEARGYDASRNAVPIATGEVEWSGQGDAVAVASDGTVTAVVAGDAQIHALAGGIGATAAVSVVIDPDPPVPGGGPVATFVPGAAYDAGIPVRVEWPAATDAGTSVADYDIELSLEGAAWQALTADLERRTADITVPSGTVSAYRLRATDEAGNTSDWTYTPGSSIQALGQATPSASFDSGWTSLASTRFVGGTALTSKVPGASFQFVSTGTQLAIFGTERPNGGLLDISIDGEPVMTVSLFHPFVQDRRILFSMSWLTAEPHTIDVVLKTSSTGTRADIDGFLMVAPPSSATLIGAGDIGSCTSDGDEATAALIDSLPGTVFTAGDNAYPSGTAANFADCYDPSWGSFRDRTRPTPGNHEHLQDNVAPYHEYFGKAAGPANRSWYAYDAGTWRVYALDSACALIGGCTAGSPQHTWLLRDLATHPRRCVLAIWHVPRFSSGSEHGSSGVTRPLLRAL
ncbi:MAG: phosphodiester glycosidase family protein, partial [Candidatus Limnocylindrales bacterium]